MVDPMRLKLPHETDVMVGDNGACESIPSIWWELDAAQEDGSGSYFPGAGAGNGGARSIDPG